MTVREILNIGNPELRVPAAEVSAGEISGDRVQSLIADLVDTMRDANGAGIAASQIGVRLQVVVMEVGSNPRYPYKPPIPLTVAINPSIEFLDDEMVMINEGCLSVPLRGEVPRHVSIRVRYFDQHGAQHDEIKRGLTAGTWQHEVDHLNGILFIDRVEDPTTLATWDDFATHHRDAFIERITKFVERVGS
ncbi:MAG: peptide deformylase [Actinobacteria bacterium]|nr:peptide deformylase [Actinomycetota bacterium]